MGLIDRLIQEVERIADDVVKGNEDLQALAKTWEQIKSHPMPRTIKEALREGWVLATQPLFATIIEYDAEQRAKDRQKLVKVRVVREALARQLSDAADRHVKGWIQILTEAVKGLLETIKGIVTAPLALIEDVVLFVTHLHAATVIFLRAQLRLVSVTTVLKEAQKMEKTMNASIAFCRRNTLPQRKGKRRYKKELVRV